ncbi:MAG: N-acetylmuramoyl-L-alanine amidase [Minisyncoccota bacterium]
MKYFIITSLLSVLVVSGFGYWFLWSHDQSFILSNTNRPFIEAKWAQKDISTEGLVASPTTDTVSIPPQTHTTSPETTGTPNASAVTPQSVPASSHLEDDQTITIVNRLMRSGFTIPAKPRNIDTIVLHSSYDAMGPDPFLVSGIIKEYEAYGVSAHYLIDREGITYQLVRDEHIAYHAGVAVAPDGRKNVNDFSLGIEIVNTQTGKMTDDQYRAVNALIDMLKKRYTIKFVVGHRDIAPDRKTDPWNLNWQKIHE